MWSTCQVTKEQQTAARIASILKYRKKNRARILTQQCAYRKKNQERIRENFRIFWKKNKARLYAQRLAYYKKNKAKILSVARRWKKKNHIELVNQQREYYKKNQALIRSKNRGAYKKNKARTNFHRACVRAGVDDSQFSNRKERAIKWHNAIEARRALSEFRKKLTSPRSTTHRTE